ncbi:MAG: carbohydrate kinase [Phycisphaerae bacterium]
MGKILGIGEVLWDIFPNGKYLGGAPVNFVYHCRQMGLDAYPVSRVGSDELGTELLGEMTTKGIPTDFIQIDPDHPSGTVRVEMTGEKHRFIIMEPAAWDFIEGDDKVMSAVRRAEAVCFGTLGQRNTASQSAIMAMLYECQGLVVFDINLRQKFFSREVIEDSLEFSHVLKLNDDEIMVIKELLGLSGQGIAEIAREILGEYGLDLVCVTRGAQGAILVSEKRVVEQPGTAVGIADTVGCGDAVTAVLVHGLVCKKELEVIARDACRVGEFVAGQAGATPVWTEELRKTI